MDSIKQKWRNHTLQKRLQQLWREYIKVSHLQDNPDTLQKFKDFLEQANQAYKSFATQNDKQLQELHGDANQILESVLNYLNKFPEIQKRNAAQGQLVEEIMEQCVQLAEQILRDPKYKKNVENSHNVLTDFLNLIERAKKNESKAIIVKLLILFSDNLNQKIEFFEQQGFQKLLSILFTRDPQLNRLISKALLHFLALDDINQVNLDIDITDDPQEVTIKQKIGNIAVFLRSFAFKELQTVFLPKQIETVQEQIVQKDKQEIITLQQAVEQEIITQQMIFEVELKFYMASQQTQGSTAEDNNNTQIIEQIISESGSPIPQLEVSEQSQDILKEFQVLQVGFKAILETLQKATTEVQLDLLSTIKQILQTNARNKFEFKKVNGYQLLSELILTKQQDTEFDVQFFDFVHQLIISNESQEIQDFDAFTLLLELLPLNSDLGLKIINNIIQSNWKNAIIARKLKLYFHLAILQLRQYFNSNQINNIIDMIENDYLSTNFRQIIQKMQFDCQQSSVIQIYDSINQLEVFYSLEFEAIQSQLAVCLLTDQEKCQPILRNLLTEIKKKLKYKCKIINSFDHHTQLVFNNLTILFQYIYKKYVDLKKHRMEYQQQIYINFILILEIVNEFLICEHKQLQPIEDEFIKKLVSQNRCEQFSSLIQPQIQQISLNQILELFDFSYKQKHEDLAAIHLQYRLNLALLFSLSGLAKEFDLEVSVALYLTYSQYEMWVQLEKQPQNPINQLIDFLLGLSKKNIQNCNALWMLMNKIELSEENAIAIENLIQYFKIHPHQEAITNLLIQFSKTNVNYINQVNLYSAIIQFIETFINKIDTESWLDLVFSSESTKKVCDKGYGEVYSDLISLISLHSIFQQQLQDKMLQSEYMTNAFETLKYHQTREQSIKLIFVLYQLNVKHKSKNQQYTSKFKIFQLIHKLIAQDKITNQLCNTIYKLCFWNFDSYHVLYPENSSNVSSIMGRSEYGEVIQKTQKHNLENRLPIQHITNLEILELFFFVLQKNESQTYILEVLKIFESILDHQNLTYLLESNIIIWLTQFKDDERVIDQSNQIIRTIITFDLQRPTKQSKIVEILKRSFYSYEIILDYLKYLQLNPIIKVEASNFLKNLNLLIQNFDELVGFSEDIEILLFQIINLMTSKNSPDVRSILRQLNYFEMRDNLALQVLKYKMDPEQLTDILAGIPFSQICNSKQFKESHCMAYLFMRLIQYQNFGLSILIIKILKYDISQNEDSKRYLSKLLQNEHLISFFFPSNRKASKSLKCFDQEDSKQQQRSNSPDQYQLGPTTTVDAFLQQFYSEGFADERKQVELTINKTLIVAENDFKKLQQKQNQKKANRFQRLEDQSEELKVQTMINEWEIKIQQRLKKSSEKFKCRQQKYLDIQDGCLAEGENQWFSINQ